MGSGGRQGRFAFFLGKTKEFLARSLNESPEKRALVDHAREDLSPSSPAKDRPIFWKPVRPMMKQPSTVIFCIDQMIKGINR
ncbi:MAG: hypothetical protein WA705_10835 [Candidatus Ozemobacteraceae bacterium]